MPSSPCRGTRCLGRGGGDFCHVRVMSWWFCHSAPSMPDRRCAPTTQDPRVLPTSFRPTPFFPSFFFSSFSVVVAWPVSKSNAYVVHHNFID